MNLRELRRLVALRLRQSALARAYDWNQYMLRWQTAYGGLPISSMDRARRELAITFCELQMALAERIEPPK